MEWITLFDLYEEAAELDPDCCNQRKVSDISLGNI